MAQDSSSLIYSVPMKGEGYYNNNSNLQRDIVLEGLHLLRHATVQVSKNPDQKLLRIIEYGASQGANSIPSLEAILQSTSKKEVAIELNDRPENDFSTLSLTITQWLDSLDRTKYPHEVLVSLRPSSFYKRLSTTQTVDLGFCFTCVHFLEDLPSYPDSHFTAIQSQETRQFLREQAQVDMEKFLRHRAAEIVAHGQLLISIVASGFGHPNFYISGPGDSCRLAVLEMASEATLTEGDLQACIVPIFLRTQADVQASLDATDQWTIAAMEQSEVLHPFWKDLQRKKDLGTYTRDDSFEYAEAMINWLMSALEPFFIRAVSKNPIHQHPHDKIMLLVKDLRSKATRIFLEKHIDSPVYVQSIYLLLERKQEN